MARCEINILWNNTIFLPPKNSRSNSDDSTGMIYFHWLYTFWSWLLSNHSCPVVSTLAKVFDHPLNDKAVKTYYNLASQRYSYSEVFLSAAQSAVFISKSNINIIQTQILKLFALLKLPLLQNFLKKFEFDHAQSTERQKTFVLIKKMEEKFEP